MNNQSMQVYDFTIIGAGSSGLWLANALNKHGILKNKTLVIVENDQQKENDRTWCYWSKTALAPIEMISKKWTSISQKSISSNRSNLTPYSYYHVRSTDFYQIIKSSLKNNPNIFWIKETVTNVLEKENQVKVDTASQSWLSDKVFLSALPSTRSEINNFENVKNFLHQAKQKKELFMWQSFAGWRIKTEKPVFNKEKLTLMNFDIDQNQYTQFLYELPFSENEALIEMTRFAKDKLSKSEAEKTIDSFLKSRNIKYEILEEETGVIPMTTAFDNHRKFLPSKQKLIYIGTLGGAIKPTSGYGFKRMHDYAEALAIAIKKNEHKATPIPTMYRKYRFRVYDSLLLSIINDKPKRGKEVFEKLFSSQPIQRILKFLDEETSIWEELLIFSKLPLALFLNALTKYLFKR